MKEIIEKWRNNILTEEKDYGDFVYEVICELSFSKKTEKQGITSTITELLTDLRAITRVTIVDSLESRHDKQRKYLKIKIKFNIKRLGKMSPASFIQRILIPTIESLDIRPKVLSITRPQDFIKV